MLSSVFLFYLEFVESVIVSGNSCGVSRRMCQLGLRERYLPVVVVLMVKLL